MTEASREVTFVGADGLPATVDLDEVTVGEQLMLLHMGEIGPDQLGPDLEWAGDHLVRQLTPADFAIVAALGDPSDVRERQRKRRAEHNGAGISLADIMGDEEADKLEADRKAFRAANPPSRRRGRRI